MITRRALLALPLGHIGATSSVARTADAATPSIPTAMREELEWYLRNQPHWYDVETLLRCLVEVCDAADRRYLQLKRSVHR